MSKQLQRKFASPVSADLLAGQAEEALRREKFKDAIELLKQLVERPSGQGRDLSLGSLGAFRLPSAIHRRSSTSPRSRLTLTETTSP